jgi:hypothetical protein
MAKAEVVSGCLPNASTNFLHTYSIKNERTKGLLEYHPYVIITISEGCSQTCFEPPSSRVEPN